MDFDEVSGLGPNCIGAPDGDCRPEPVGLSGVDIISQGRIHDEHRPGETVFNTFSGSDSTLLLGVSNLHICAQNAGILGV